MKHLYLTVTFVCFFACSSFLPAQQIQFGSGGWGIGIGGPAYSRYDDPYGYGPNRGYNRPYGGYNRPYGNQRSGSGFYYQKHRGHSHWGVILDLDEPYYGNTYGNTVTRERVVVEPRRSAPQEIEPSRPPVPTSDELVSMNWRQLRQILQFASREFDKDLSRLKTGSSWKKHLSVGTMGDLVAEEDNVPPQPETHEVLAKILGRYSKADANNGFVAITRMWGFRTIHVTLVEYTKPTDVRQREHLAVQLRNLNEAVTRWRSGHTWQKYFALPKSFVSKVDEEANAEDVTSELAALQELLSKFDSVAQNPKYDQVAGLSEFKATHKTLGEYVAGLIPPPPIDAESE